MENPYFKHNQIICSKIFTGEDGYFHYVYRIQHIPTGKYYIGIHTTSNLNDGYCGSGTNIMRVIKKYGPKQFVKIILSFHNTPRELEEAEANIVTEDEINNPMCYNINCGGSHHPTKSVTCIDTHTNKHVRVPQDEYYSHPERYVSPTKGMIKATDGTGNIFMVKSDDPRLKTGEIWDYVATKIKGTFPAIVVATGQKIRVSVNDPRLKTGEVTHVQKGRIKITKDGKDKYINESELHAWEQNGWVRGSQMLGKVKGPNPYKGWPRIYKNGVRKIIHPSELDKYLAEGWQRGYTHLKQTIIHKNGIEKHIPVIELDKYLAEGWTRGNPNKVCLGKISINKDGVRKFISRDELDKYLAEGWQRGLNHCKNKKAPTLGRGL